MTSLKLLKENPKLFKRKDLKELRYILDENGYKETELNSAYGKVENVNITADILSYIKKVLKGSTILDKEEKIQDIEKRIKRLNNWNPIQLKIIEKMTHTLKEINSPQEQMKTYIDPSYPISKDLVLAITEFVNKN